MFCFITSLRSRQASGNWAQVCELFERTATSIFAQSNPNFRLIVVGHEKPKLSRAFDERLEFIAVDLPVPSSTYLSKAADKRRKLVTGLRRARKIGADFVMSMDADDLVSRRLVEFVLSHPESDGWYLTQGFKHEYGTAWLEPIRQNFNLVCGSCNWPVPGLVDTHLS